jgi:Ricin-type beta-trefoil lectin domain/Bacterial tandem repeat domain 1
MAQVIKATIGGKCIDISSINPNKDTVVHLWAIHGGANQQFELTQEGYITSSLDPTKCLQVEDSNTSNGARIIYAEKQDKPNQFWSYSPITKQFISALDDKKCLTAQGNVNQDGSPLVLSDKSGINLGQAWEFAPAPISPIPSAFSYLNEGILNNFWLYPILERRAIQTICRHYPNGNINLPPVVSGSFIKGLPLQYRLHTNLDTASFQKKIDLYKQQGYRLSQISVFSTLFHEFVSSPMPDEAPVPIQRQIDISYSGIWRKMNKGEEVFMFIKVSDAEFGNYWNDYVGKRNLIVDEHIMYKFQGQVFHAVIFTNQSKGGFIMWYSQTIDNLYKRHEENKRNGNQLVSFNINFEREQLVNNRMWQPAGIDGDQLIFGGVWQPTGKDSFFLLDMTHQQFQQRCSELEPLGYTLQKVQTYYRRVSGDWSVLYLEKFGAIWVKTETVAFNTKIPTIKKIDLLTLVPQARWIGGELIDNDNMKDENPVSLQGGEDWKGMVRFQDSVMEDNGTYKILFTHPRWVNRGCIKGWLPRVPLPKQACFMAKVGFINGATGSDGVTFQVWAHFDNTWERQVTTYKPYNGKLQNIWADLSHLEGKNVGIELRVDAGSSSGQDWAAWIEPCIYGFQYEQPIRFTNMDKIFRLDNVPVLKLPKL